MPIVILVFIGAFSLPVLFKQQEIPEADITIKATGYQWYWGYEYPDHGFRLRQLHDRRRARTRCTDEIRAELQEAGYSQDEFLLATDTAVVVPVGKTIVVQVTGADVIHSWTIPAFGVKQDAVPGRLAELWFKAEQEGIYFGQCSELCGKDHAYMPITVKVVSQEEYDAWLERAIQELRRATPAVDDGLARHRSRSPNERQPSPRTCRGPVTERAMQMTDSTASPTSRPAEAGLRRLLRAAEAAGDVAGRLHRAGRPAGRAGVGASGDRLRRDPVHRRRRRRLGRAEHVVGRRHRRGDAAHRASARCPRAGQPRARRWRSALALSVFSVVMLGARDELVRRRAAGLHHLLLRRRLLDVAEALDAAEHRDRRRRRGLPADDRLGRGHGRHASKRC